MGDGTPDLKSMIADMKNIGGARAGSINGGQFYSVCEEMSVGHPTSPVRCGANGARLWPRRLHRLRRAPVEPFHC